jgi:hypothetical protein
VTTDHQGPAPTRLAALLLDAQDALIASAEAIPAPGQGGALGRLNPGGWIVAHLAEQQDRVWNVGAQGLEPDPWLLANGERFRTGAEPVAPVYAEALEALRRAVARTRPYLEALSLADVEGEAPGGTPEPLGVRLARNAAHCYSHAGELAAIAALVGSPGAALPGPLTHSRRARG